MPIFPTPAIKSSYSVRAGDTLSGIAAANGISLDMLLSVNNLPDPDQLTIGQVINFPAMPETETGDYKIIPDGRLIRGPGSAGFDIEGFIASQPGYIHLAADTVNDQLLTGTEVIRRVSLEYSVDARLLLALLEYKAKWLSQLELDDIQKSNPMEGQASPDGIDRTGLYKQLSWAANQLNMGYYGWKYRASSILELPDSVRMRYSSGLNPATVGIQYFLSQNSSYANWLQAVSQNGFHETYLNYFGDPFSDSVAEPVPPDISQPVLAFPFPKGQTWFFTGGPHGGWGSGSAWAAIDFAPPDDRPDDSSLCYVSENWGTAVAAGVIDRSEDGSVILDLDMDGNEATGWTILYLHMASDGRVKVGTTVQPGDPIGKPSCEGGFSNATHMHIARRYNGEWIPVDCDSCSFSDTFPAFVMAGWTVHGLTNQEYQGNMVDGEDQRTAEQGRLTPINRVSW
ncbi:MAG: LysM peptidoglycan-binding domain-containing M23 family metallopeptidase [Chloroflexota bacterium]